MEWIDIRIHAETVDQMEKLKEKLFELLMKDENLYDYFIQAEGDD